MSSDLSFLSEELSLFILLGFHLLLEIFCFLHSELSEVILLIEMVDLLLQLVNSVSIGCLECLIFLEQPIEFLSQLGSFGEHINAVLFQTRDDLGSVNHARVEALLRWDCAATLLTLSRVASLYHLLISLPLSHSLSHK